MLEGDAYKSEVPADEDRARGMGARGVPFFVFGRKDAVGGAQPPEVFSEVIERVIAEKA